MPFEKKRDDMKKHVLCWSHIKKNITPFLFSTFQTQHYAPVGIAAWQNERGSSFSNQMESSYTF